MELSIDAPQPLLAYHPKFLHQQDHQLLSQHAHNSESYMAKQVGQSLEKMAQRCFGLS